MAPWRHEDADTTLALMMLAMALPVGVFAWAMGDELASLPEACLRFQG